jgi:hypothetical protein
MALSTAFKTMIEADLASAMLDWSETLTHIKTGQQISGTISPLNSERDVDPAGILESSDREFVCKRSDFTSIPENGDNVRVQGKAYHILNSIDDSALLHLFLRVN